MESLNGAAFHSIHNGVLAEDTWVEIAIGSTESVTKAKLTTRSPINTEVWEFEFNDTGDKAKDHFARDVNKLADCEGAYTFLFIFMRDKTFSDKKDKFKPKYFEKLIEKVEPFSPSKFPDKIYYINAQTKLMRNTIAARYNGIEVFTQDSKEIEILQQITIILSLDVLRVLPSSYPEYRHGAHKTSRKE